MPTIMVGIRLLAVIGVRLELHLWPCYIIFAMFFNINDLFNTQDYLVEIFQGNQCVTKEKTIAPPEIMQAQFMQMCVQLKQSGQPMKIRLTRFEWVEGRTEPLELYLEYQTWEDDA